MRTLILLCCLSLATAALANGRKDPSMREAAASLLALMRPEQLTKIQFAFNSDERLNWHYVPQARQGLSLENMSEPQKSAATALIRTGLSDKGFQKTETIRSLENVLHEIEQGRGPLRDPGNYYITIFGTPSDREPWGWRYEGHHISLHWTEIDGKVIASSPQFLGSNPAEVRSGPMKGTRVLAAEEDLARTLVKSLDGTQRGEAILSVTAPPDIVTTNARKVAILEDRGVAYHELNHMQQGVMLALIQEHASAQRAPIARRRLDGVRKAGLANVKFGWMGGVEKGDPHYYRIQGPTFLIEYDCTQDHANHIHTVWRDFNGDFGADLLEMHYLAAQHDRAHGHDPQSIP